MPDVDSEHDGWSLRDAIMRTSDPMLLASLAQKRLELGRQPWWWVPQSSARSASEAKD